MALHFIERSSDTADRHVCFQPVTIARLGCGVRNVGDTIAHTAALARGEVAEHDIVLDPFGQVLGIGAVVKVFIGEPAIEAYLVEQIDDLL